MAGQEAEQASAMHSLARGQNRLLGGVRVLVSASFLHLLGLGRRLTTGFSLVMAVSTATRRWPILTRGTIYLGMVRVSELSSSSTTLM